MLIESKMDVNFLSKDKVSALALASYEGHTSLVRKLLEHGANVNVRTIVEFLP